MNKLEIKIKQPWLNSALSDSIFILSPPFLSLLLVFCFPEQFKVSTAMPVQYWVLLVVFIDVAHVYSTLYRTYFNIDRLKKQHTLLIAVPLICYFSGVILYHIDGLVFWRVLAYLAVFHFIRQQYGFMRLYSRTESPDKIACTIDVVAIYTATLYPILSWHFGETRNFNWFVDGDFIYFPSKVLETLFTYLYLVVISAYLIKEIGLLIKKRVLNIPRNLLIAGTFLSWYFGIVYFNGDMAFTTLNVISHGIPYMALIWFFEKKNHQQQVRPAKSILAKVTFGKYGVLVFILMLILLAYVEEGLWDGFVWKEHTHVFSIFSSLPKVMDVSVLALLIPLLALPQSTHYVLDGFIWKREK
jgi:hypothetical protein